MEQRLREGLDEAVSALSKQAALEVLSGDRPRLVERLRDVFGGKAEFTVESRPHEKRELVTKRQAGGDRMMMVGDGLNDASALQQSDVGLAVSDDLHRFSPACDALMQAGSLRHLAEVLSLSAATRTVVKVCFGLSFSYNIVGLSLAATGNLSPLAASERPTML